MVNNSDLQKYIVLSQQQCRLPRQGGNRIHHNEKWKLVGINHMLIFKLVKYIKKILSPTQLYVFSLQFSFSFSWTNSHSFSFQFYISYTTITQMCRWAGASKLLCVCKQTVISFAVLSVLKCSFCHSFLFVAVVCSLTVYK